MVSILHTIDTSHEDMIHDAEIDYYGLRLATCSADNTVKIYDIKNGIQTLAADLKGHLGPVWQVAWAHPRYGNLLASCSYDRKVIVWKENGNEWIKWYENIDHDSSVNSISWAPADLGLILACGSSDGSVSVITRNSDTGNWDVKKILNAHTIGCNAVSWGPAVSSENTFDFQGRTATTKQFVKRLVTGGCDNLVKIWCESGDNWVEEHRLEVHSDWVRDVAWAPSIGLPRTQIASCSQDRRVVIWTSDDTYSNWTPTILHTFDDVVWNVSWSLTSNILAVSGGDNKVSLWRENNESQWCCISEVNKGQGQISTEQRAL
uniref:Protein SEC13 homolog n=1 Tax=Xenopsylla cheopis TaxID=163159 RepID=A0A6M2DM25_XENCH